MNKKILEFLAAGFELTFGRVTISRIGGMVQRYQVFSDDYRFKCSEVYPLEDIELAIDKFVLIINQIKAKSSAKSVKNEDSVV